ncbi:MAG: lysophospholipid acyltransferase family protein [Fimbriimonadaceae bacterium]|nr:lysophospholipid acyltransferase family protein [Fimbriimonadaceae bacterium]QYK58190.1 MAG: lysophospholipid acyltransferase family protein [Fimbriimonadaceae bacterium]
MKQHWRNVRPYVLAPLIYALVRLIGLTLRIETRGFERIAQNPGSRIMAGWHGRTLVAALFFRGQGLVTIISQSKDGEMQDRIFRWLGFRTIRGSTGRGGVTALRESIEALRQGAAMAFTPDGPRGPSGVVQQGIMIMAKKSGAALVPVGVSADRRWLAPTWDRYMVPKPFAKCLMVFGEPICLSPDADDASLEEARADFERQMHLLQAEAEAECGHPGA